MFLFPGILDGSEFERCKWAVVQLEQQFASKKPRAVFN